MSPRSTLELASVALSAAGEDSTETLPGKALSSDKGNDSASLVCRQRVRASTTHHSYNYRHMSPRAQ